MLELGCGLGSLSISCLSQFAKKAIATDGNDLVLDHLESNIVKSNSVSNSNL